MRGTTPAPAPPGVGVNANTEADASTERDPLVTVSLISGIGFTATAEYDLARTIGATVWVAVLLPLALDVYVVAAIRRARGRDIALSLVLMGTAQIAAHMLAARVVAVSVPLVAAVSLLVPLSIWRVHALAVLPAKKKADSERQLAPATPPAQPPIASPADRQNEAPQAPPPGATTDRQEEPEPERQLAPVSRPSGATERPSARRQRTAKKTAVKRRSMDDWVVVAGPVFHDEFARLRRNPTASEFATAIAKSGLGKVGESTAKNIRAEILDRTPLPSLDGDN
ncbi:hypothetical protein [Streptomyces sp. NPDC056682]|uniref:hypothetical protein n=1 Tax=Streptomyces sp. NPDC056682 TaxID=3345909 RepID=UPI0036CBE085